MAVPPVINRQWEEMNREHELRRAEHEAQAARNDQSWLDWKAKLTADPEAVFAEDAVGTLCLIDQWLDHRENRDTTIAKSNWRDVRRVLGDAVADLFETNICAYWRDRSPPEPSDGAGGGVTRTRGDHLASTGLLVEASIRPGWEKALLDVEVDQAAAWARLEYGNFPAWFSSLAVAHPERVRASLLRELEKELELVDVLPYPNTLTAIQQGGAVEKGLVADYLRQSLFAWPEPVRNDQSAYVTNLDRVLSLLSAAGRLDADAGDLCSRRFLEEPTKVGAATWLQGTFSADMRKGFNTMKGGLDALPSADRSKYALEWFAAVFGSRDYSRIPIAAASDGEILVELAKLSYAYIRREDDIEHEGVFSPGPRDNAESARNRILSSLIELPGPDAHRGLCALATEPIFAHMPDRLRLMARERAAADSEPQPLSTEQFTDWETRYSVTPRNRDELFGTMMGRIEDIVHDTRHHDFSDRHVLAAILSESEMQPLLAKKFADSARGDYQVVREDEVADKKETDIRLVASAFKGKAVIEIKIGDNDYSINDLRATIRDQMLGQYMRHDDCTAGCLLVTFAGGKKFRDPQSGATLSFEQVVSALAAYATELETQERGRVRLGVMGLDLRNPLDTGAERPAPAARRSVVN